VRGRAARAYPGQRGGAWRPAMPFVTGPPRLAGL